MIVVCVNNNFGYLSEPWHVYPLSVREVYYQGLETGKVQGHMTLLIGNQYKVIGSDSESFLIELGWYYRWRFVTLESYRDKQIDNIFT